jgi:hypothetical protein
MGRGGVAVAAPPRAGSQEVQRESRGMRNGRSIAVMAILALYCACSGGEKTVGPPAGAVASIAVGSTTTTSVFIESTLPLVASAYDATGAAIAGQTFTWSSSNTLVATVSSSGVVTGVSAGVASISASIGNIVGQNTITVSASAAQLSCTSVTPLSMNVGDVHPLAGVERSSLCINGGAGSEYALIAFNTSLDTSTAASAVNLVATNTVLTTNAPNPQLIAGRPGVSSRAVPRNVDFEMRMRETERRELNPRFAAARAWYAGRERSLSPQRGVSAITGLGPSPTIGSSISLNGNANSACSAPQPHGATIVAVSTHAIIAVDTLTPPNGFTNADYQNFAAAFDTLIFPLDTLNYGTPSDIDNNGRELLFFSPLVNALSSPTSTSYVGGFFFSRDLFPLANTATLAACAGSNVGEMFYLPVVDPTQIYNRFFRDKDTVTSQILTTIVHEFQHLINAGRHLYVNLAATRLEESWLDESQAMLAQELLYYRVSGFAPRQKLTWTTISSGANANGNQLDIVNAYLVQGLGALNFYLQVPESSTPYDNTENLATLGAGWQFMRYLLDNTTGTQSTFSRAIDNGVVTGFANVANVFSLSLPALANTYQSWAIAQYVDGTGVTSNPAYSNPSWNFRSVIPNALGLSGGYPLRIRPLLPATPVSVVLRGGAAAYIRLRVNAGITAQIMPANGITASTAVTYVLIRTF